MTRFEVETWSKEAPLGVRSPKGVRWQKWERELNSVLNVE